MSAYPGHSLAAASTNPRAMISRSFQSATALSSAGDALLDSEFDRCPRTTTLPTVYPSDGISLSSVGDVTSGLPAPMTNGALDTGSRFGRTTSDTVRSNGMPSLFARDLAEQTIRARGSFACAALERSYAHTRHTRSRPPAWPLTANMSCGSVSSQSTHVRRPSGSDCTKNESPSIDARAVHALLVRPGSCLHTFVPMVGYCDLSAASSSCVQATLRPFTRTPLSRRRPSNFARARTTRRDLGASEPSASATPSE